MVYLYCLHIPRHSPVFILVRGRGWPRLICGTGIIAYNQCSSFIVVSGMSSHRGKQWNESHMRGAIAEFREGKFFCSLPVGLSQVIRCSSTGISVILTTECINKVCLCY